MPNVAIQVVLYHSSKHLGPLLDSLSTQTFRDFDILFYENSTDDAELERCKQLIAACGLRTTLTVGKKNLGYTAHNELFSQSDAPLVLVLNDDTLVDPSCLERMVAAMESDPKIAAVTPLIFRVVRGTQWLPHISDETIVDSAGHEYRLLSDIRDIGSGKKWGEMKSSVGSSGEVFGASGTAALYRRSAILSVSPDNTLYDPTFFMYKEDTDLNIRLRRGGWKAWRASDAIMFHARSMAGKPSLSWSRLKTERLRPPVLRRWSYRNTHHLYTYHWSPRIGVKDLVVGFLFEVLRSGGVFIASPSVWFGAISDLIRSFPDAYRRRRRMERMGLPHIKMTS